MSNLAINIRILFWHFQVTFDREVSFEFNPFHWKKNRRIAILCPIEIYDFDLKSLRSAR